MNNNGDTVDNNHVPTLEHELDQMGGSTTNNDIESIHQDIDRHIKEMFNCWIASIPFDCHVI